MVSTESSCAADIQMEHIYYIEVYTSPYTHAAIISEKMDHEFEGEQGRAYVRAYRKKREGQK